MPEPPATEPPAITLAPDQEKRLLQQQKKRATEIRAAASAAKREELLAKLAAQADKAEKAQQAAATSEAAALRELKPVEAELSKARASADVLTKLTTTLHGRQREALQKRQEVLTREERSRQELSDRFQARVGEVSGRLEELSAQRIAQARESDRVANEMREMVTSHREGEEAHAELLRCCEARSACLQAELGAQAEDLEAAKRREADLREALEASAAVEAELRAKLAEHGARMDGFKDELEASNVQFATHKAALAAARAHLTEVESAHGAVKARKIDEARAAKQGKADEEALRAEAAKLGAQVERLRGVCASLREEIDARQS